MKISREIKVGALALVSLTLLYLGFNFLKGIDFFSRVQTYYVVYEDVGGLVPSNPIVYRGMSIGRVEDVVMRPDMGNKIVVTLTVRDEYVVGKGATATLTEKDIVSGSKKIVLDAGDPNAPLAEGDTLVALRSPGLTDQVELAVMPIVDRVDSTLAQVQLLLAALSDGRLDSITGSLNDAVQQVPPTMANLRRTSNSFASLAQSLETTNKEQLQPLLATLSSVADSLQDSSLKQLVNETTAAMENVNSITAKIDQGEGSAGKLVNDSTLYDNLAKATASLDSLLIDLKEHPKAYVHFSLFGRKDKRDRD